MPITMSKVHMPKVDKNIDLWDRDMWDTYGIKPVLLAS